MLLLLNTLIEWPQLIDDVARPHTERILWLDASSSNVIVIKLFDRRALPIRRLYKEIADAISANEAHILQTDPYSNLLRPENEIKESHRKHRDAAWGLIEGLIANADLQEQNPYERMSSKLD